MSVMAFLLQDIIPSLTISVFVLLVHESVDLVQQCSDIVHANQHGHSYLHCQTHYRCCLVEIHGQHPDSPSCEPRRHVDDMRDFRRYYNDKETEYCKNAKQRQIGVKRRMSHDQGAQESPYVSAEISEGDLMRIFEFISVGCVDACSYESYRSY